MKELDRLYKKNANRNSIPFQEVYHSLPEESKKRIAIRSAYYDALYALREAREKQGLSQEDLSAQTGIPRATISKIESGKRNVTFDTLITLLAALKLKCKFVKL